MNFKYKTLILIIAVISIFGLNCINSNANRNIENVNKLQIGNDINGVELLMGSKPNKVIFDNEVYIKQKLHKNITTFVYDTPGLASSDIYLHFSDSILIYIAHDL